MARREDADTLDHVDAVVAACTEYHMVDVTAPDTLRPLQKTPRLHLRFF